MSDEHSDVVPITRAPQFTRTGKPVANPVAPMRPGRNGGQLRSGGTSPNSGRRPSGISTKMRDLVESPDVWKRFVDVLHDPTHSRWFDCMRLALAYGWGQPTSHVDVRVGLLNALEALTPSELDELVTAPKEEFEARCVALGIGVDKEDVG